LEYETASRLAAERRAFPEVQRRRRARALELTDQGKRRDRRVRTAGLSMTEARTAIAFHEVSKSYGGSASPVLDRVSLEVREREFLAVVGPSGSARKGAQPSYESGMVRVTDQEYVKNMMFDIFRKELQ
jgi:ABC-type multidrug transport system fused ATPase/permease subunit